MHTPSPPSSTRPEDGRDAGGRTTPVQHDGPKPRLPHERDESADSQQSAAPQIGEVGRQGLEDVQRGLQDTDRGPVTDSTYNDKVVPPGGRTGTPTTRR